MAESRKEYVVTDARTRREIIRNKQIRCLLLLLLHRRRRKRLNTNKLWVRDILQNRNSQGEYNGLLQELRLNHHDAFVHFNRMTPKQFDHLLSLVGPVIRKETTKLRDPVSPGERLAITLRYLATGDSQRTIAYSFRVGYSTTAALVKETCEAIWDVLQPIFLKPLRETDLEDIADSFYEQWDFPNCVGPMVAVKLGIHPGSAVKNDDGEPSKIILIASCDTDYRFTFVDVDEYLQWNAVFLTSNLGAQLESKSIPLPAPRPLPGGDPNSAMPFVFAAYHALQLKDYMLRPYPTRADNEISKEELIFNYRINRVINVVRNALGVMSARWGIFRGNIVAKPDKVVQIVKALVCLHNFLLSEDVDSDNEEFLYLPPGYVDSEDHLGKEIQGKWRSESSNCFEEAKKLGSNNFNRRAYLIREKMKDYFVSSVGEIPQQYTLNDTQ